MNNLSENEENWLEILKLDVSKATATSDGIDYDGDVNITNTEVKGLAKLPIKFNRVGRVKDGQFVGGIFNLGKTKFKSLEGSPKKCGIFIVNSDNLTNFLGGPEECELCLVSAPTSSKDGMPKSGKFINSHGRELNTAEQLKIVLVVHKLCDSSDLQRLSYELCNTPYGAQAFLDEFKKLPKTGKNINSLTKQLKDQTISGESVLNALYNSGTYKPGGLLKDPKFLDFCLTNGLRDELFKPYKNGSIVAKFICGTNVLTGTSLSHLATLGALNPTQSEIQGIKKELTGHVSAKQLNKLDDIDGFFVKILESNISTLPDGTSWIAPNVKRANITPELFERVMPIMNPKTVPTVEKILASRDNQKILNRLFITAKNGFEGVDPKYLTAENLCVGTNDIPFVIAMDSNKIDKLPPEVVIESVLKLGVSKTPYLSPAIRPDTINIDALKKYDFPDSCKKILGETFFKIQADYKALTQEDDKTEAMEIDLF